MKKDKTKDIIESVLPATRKAAHRAKENKAAIKRRSRRIINERVRGINDIEDYMDEASDLEFYPNAELNYAREERRLSDNLGALLRWGKYRINHELKNMSDDDRYFWFKSVLPDCLQGRHALDHIQTSLLPNVSWGYYSAYSPEYYEQRRKAYRREKLEERDEVVRLLCKILTEGYHKRFNAKLKSMQPDPFLLWLEDPSKEYTPKRHLEGWHDLEDFADWISSPKRQKYARLIVGHSYTNNYLTMLKTFFD